MPNATHSFNRTDHKAFIDRLQQSSPALLYSAENKDAIEAYLIGWFYTLVDVAYINHSYRTRPGYKIDAVAVTYSYR